VTSDPNSKLRAFSRVVRPGDAASLTLERDDARYWESIPVDERMRFVFELSLDQWRLHGWRDDLAGAGLRGAVARVHRP
jgi:hypothetical protein